MRIGKTVKEHDVPVRVPNWPKKKRRRIPVPNWPKRREKVKVGLVKYDQIDKGD